MPFKLTILIPIKIPVFIFFVFFLAFSHGGIFAQEGQCAYMPVPTGTIGSSYGWRIHPNSGLKKFHNGIDIKARAGDPVYAAFEGEVIAVQKSDSGYGNLIKIMHADGMITIYAHLSSVAVKKGQRVEKGQIIGKIGMTGNATGPHLHFEIIRENENLDPRLFL